MNWQAIGAVGEMAAALAVVFSFFYLAAQIRQNTRQLEEQRRTQRQDLLFGARATFSDWRSLVIRDPALATLWGKGNQGLGQLAEDERIRWDFLLVDFFWAYATIWMEISQGLLEESLGEMSLKNVAVYAGPGVRAWWATSPHRAEYPEGFVERIDELFRAAETDELQGDHRSPIPSQEDAS